jgi:hypothetical protein
MEVGLIPVQEEQELAVAMEDLHRLQGREASMADEETTLDWVASREN